LAESPQSDWLAEAKQVVADQPFAALATAGADGAPRSVVVTPTLQDGVFTWQSDESRTHSAQIADNPRIGFSFLSGTRAVYGIGAVDQIEPGERHTYRATVTELTFVTNQKVDGEFVPPQKLDPKSI
jgi:pyridoxine/pyridoxamine 5'-phosphate oxidase